MILHLYVHYTHLLFIGQLLVCCWCVSLTNFTSISPPCSSIFYWSVIGQLLGIYWDVVLTNFTSIYPLFSSTFIVQLLGCCWCVDLINFTAMSSLFPSIFYCAVIGVLLVTFTHPFYTNYTPIVTNGRTCEVICLCA